MARYYYLTRASLWLLFTFGSAVLDFRWKAMTVLHLPKGIVLSAQEQRQLKHYFYGATYLAIVFGCLRNQARSSRKMELFITLSALAYFFDDLSILFIRKRTVLPFGKTTQKCMDWLQTNVDWPFIYSTLFTQAFLKNTRNALKAICIGYSMPKPPGGSISKNQACDKKRPSVWMN